MEDKKVLLQRWITPSGKLLLFLQVRDNETNQLIKEFNLIDGDRKAATEYLFNDNFIKVVSGDLFTLTTVIIEFGNFMKTFSWKREINYKYDSITEIKEELEKRFTEILKWKRSLVKNEVIELDLPNDYDLDNYNFEEL